MRELKPNYTARRFHATVSREYCMRCCDLKVAFDWFVARMWHRVDKALRIGLVLQNSSLVPSLVDGRIVVVAEFPFELISRLIPSYLYIRLLLTDHLPPRPHQI